MTEGPFLILRLVGLPADLVMPEEGEGENANATIAKPAAAAAAAAAAEESASPQRDGPDFKFNERREKRLELMKTSVSTVLKSESRTVFLSISTWEGSMASHLSSSSFLMKIIAADEGRQHCSSSAVRGEAKRFARPAKKKYHAATPNQKSSSATGRAKRRILFPDQ
jgi:hypothetical protein